MRLNCGVFGSIPLNDSGVIEKIARFALRADIHGGGGGAFYRFWVGVVRCLDSVACVGRADSRARIAMQHPLGSVVDFWPLVFSETDGLFEGVCGHVFVPGLRGQGDYRT